VPGKNAARLSEHYKLDCDFGTSVIDIFKTGDCTDPVYLCEAHVGEVRRVKAPSAEIRLVERASEYPIEAPAHAASVVPLTEPATSKESIAPGEEAAPIAAAKPAAPVAPVATAAPRPVATISGPKVQRATAASRTAKRDLTFGNSAKALVDEAIWNLATGDYELYRSALRLGKSPGEAAQAAGGQLAAVHRKMCEYAVKFESVLAASTVKMDTREVIEMPFESAMADIVGNETIGDAERDAAVTMLGALQETVNRGLEPEMTPLQAYRIACAIGERANWGAPSSVAAELKPAYRAIYGSVRKAMRTAVPHANHLEERLTNLFAAKCELENEPSSKAAQALTA
jgi:hypothetical protein